MQTRVAIKVPVRCALLLALVGLVGGCGEDSPSIPQLPERFPNSPDQLMANVFDAYSGRDYASYLHSIHPSYHMVFSEAEATALGMSGHEFNAAEDLQAVFNQFLGLSGHLPGGTVVSPIVLFTVLLRDPVGTWAPAAPDDPDFPGQLGRRYSVILAALTSNGPEFLISGYEDFFVSSRDSALSGGGHSEYWQVIGQRDLTDANKSAVPASWASLKLMYLNNQAPVASIVIRAVAGSAGAYDLDASASHDPETGLSGLDYRWRVAPGTQWSTWQAHPDTQVSFTFDSSYAVDLQVRDKWGASGQCTESVVVSGLALPFPDSPDQLITNFRTVYTSMDLDRYRDEVLNPDYGFIFRPEDVVPGESDRFTCAEEIEAAENMFSGLPVERPGNTPVPAISSISIAALDRQSTWIDVGPTAPDFPNTRRALYVIQLTFSRAGANTIIVNGQQEFFVTSRDSLVDGVTKPYFRLSGQRDLTVGLKVENDSWGSMKHLYSN